MTRQQELEILKQRYRISIWSPEHGLNHIYPTNAQLNGNLINGFGAFSAYVPKPKSYEPARMGLGNLERLRDIPRFPTPRLRVNWNLSNLETYYLWSKWTDPPDYKLGFYVPEYKMRIAPIWAYRHPREYPELTKTWHVDGLSITADGGEFVATNYEYEEDFDENAMPFGFVSINTMDKVLRYLESQGQTELCNKIKYAGIEFEKDDDSEIILPSESEVAL